MARAGFILTKAATDLRQGNDVSHTVFTYGGQ